MGSKLKQAIALGKQLAEANKPKPCTACGGSGHYDVTGSPRCGHCHGTGVEPGWKG